MQERDPGATCPMDDVETPPRRMISTPSEIPIDIARGFNALPSALLAAGWTGPLVVFWMRVFGVFGPSHVPPDSMTPTWHVLLLLIAGGCSLSRLPTWYVRIRSFERSGRVYHCLGVHLFRRVVPHGDIANHLERRRQPDFRMLRNRSTAAAYAEQTVIGERTHLVLLAMGLVSSTYAWQIDWPGWAFYFTFGNIIANVYPILLQRYTRARLVRLKLAS